MIPIMMQYIIINDKLSHLDKRSYLVFVQSVIQVLQLRLFLKIMKNISIKN